VAKRDCSSVCRPTVIRDQLRRFSAKHFKSIRWKKDFSASSANILFERAILYPIKDSSWNSLIKLPAQTLPRKATTRLKNTTFYSIPRGRLLIRQSPTEPSQPTQYFIAVVLLRYQRPLAAGSVNWRQSKRVTESIDTVKWIRTASVGLCAYNNACKPASWSIVDTSDGRTFSIYKSLWASINPLTPSVAIW